MATRTARTAPAKATRKPAKDARTGRRFPAKGKAPAKAAKKVPTTTGPSKATMDFAKKVVAARDRQGLPWAEVAAKMGVKYDQNGSSRLRRAYILGGGKTVGVRKARA